MTVGCSVERFHADCQEALLQLSAHISSVDDVGAADLDVADLRLTSLDEELAAARAEAASTAAEHDGADDADKGSPLHAAPAGAAAEVASTAAGARSAAAHTNAGGQTPDRAAADAAREHGNAAVSTSPASAAVNTAAAGAAAPVADTAPVAASANAADDGGAGLRSSSDVAPPARRSRRPNASCNQLPVIPSPPRRSARTRQPSREAMGTAEHSAATDQLAGGGKRAADQPPAAVPATKAGQDTQQLDQHIGEDAPDADNPPPLPPPQQPQLQQQPSEGNSKRR